MNNFKILTQKKSLFLIITLFASMQLSASERDEHNHHHDDHRDHDTHAHTTNALFDTHHTLNIVTTIAPLQSLIKNVVGDEHTVHTLIKQNSVHVDHLKPSQFKQVVAADIVIHLHDELEFFISNLPETTLPYAKRITIAKHLKSPLLKLAKEGHHNEHDEYNEHQKNDDEHDDEHDDHNHSSEFDLHFWLDPLIAMQIVDIIAAELGELHPSKAREFKHNADNYKRILRKLHTSIQKQITATKDTQFLVFHNAYAYFIHQYGLKNQLVSSEQFLMSVKEVTALKEQIAKSAYACAIIDEEHSSKNIDKLLKQTGLPLFHLNPIGLEFMDLATTSKDLYVQLLQSITNTFSTCLR